MVPSSVLPLEDEEDISSLTDTIQEFKRGIGLPFPFVDVQGGLGGELGVALEALGKYVEGRFNEVAKLAEKIDAKLATMAIRAADSKSKAKRKVAKLDRTADDDHAYTYIKVLTSFRLITLPTLLAGCGACCDPGDVGLEAE